MKNFVIPMDELWGPAAKTIVVSPPPPVPQSKQEPVPAITAADLWGGGKTFKVNP